MLRMSRTNDEIKALDHMFCVRGVTGVTNEIRVDERL